MFGQMDIIFLLISWYINDYPLGIMFIKFVDASTNVKDVALLCELLDGLIQQIGVQHVVQTIIDNAINDVVVDMLLMEKHPRVSSKGISYCIDLKLKDIDKIPSIKERSK